MGISLPKNVEESNGVPIDSVLSQGARPCAASAWHGPAEITDAPQKLLKS
jgi:hypothetical protein